MLPIITTATGYRNLQSYSHVYQPVTSFQVTSDNIGYDPAQYRKVIMLDMEETERDNTWIREEIRKVLIQTELLRHQFRHSQADEERKRAYEMERRRREEEERRRWEDEMARRRHEEEERRRFEDEQRRRQDEERRRLEEERRRLEAERRRLEEEEKKKLRETQTKPQVMGRFPDAGDIISVFIVRGEDLRQMGRYASMYTKVGFDGQPTLPYRTKSASNSGEPVWEEKLPDMYMPYGARQLLLEVYEDETRDNYVGQGQLDLRSEENEIHAVDIINRGGMRQGKVYMRYNTRHPPPPPPPPIPAPPAPAPTPAPQPTGHSNLDLEIIKGRNLIDMDVIGEGDPYVQLLWGNSSKPFFTTKVSKGRNPIWNEGVNKVDVPDDVDFVSIMVWDKDRFDKDDFMGVYYLKLLPPPDGEFWVPLHVREGEPADAKLAKKGNLGELNIKAHYTHVPGHGGPKGSVKPSGPPPAFIPTECKVTIVSAEGLAPADPNGKSDPYVTIGIGSQPSTKEHKTTVKKKTLTPVWNESFKLTVPKDVDHLVFTAFDDDLLSKDEFLGQVGLDTSPAARVSGAYVLTLQPRANNPMDEKLAYKNHGLGKLRLQTEWVGPPPSTSTSPSPSPSPSPPPPVPVAVKPPAGRRDSSEMVEEF